MPIRGTGNRKITQTRYASATCTVRNRIFMGIICGHYHYRSLIYLLRNFSGKIAGLWSRSCTHIPRMRQFCTSSMKSDSSAQFIRYIFDKWEVIMLDSSTARFLYLPILKALLPCLLVAPPTVSSKATRGH